MKVREKGDIIGREQREDLKRCAEPDKRLLKLNKEQVQISRLRQGAYFTLPTANMNGAIRRMKNSSVWYRPLEGVLFGGVVAICVNRAWTTTSVALSADIMITDGCGEVLQS